MKTTKNHSYLTMSQVKEYLNISQSAAYELAHRRDFPVCRIGNSIRVPKEPFYAWIEMQTSVPEQLRSYMERSA